MRLPFLFVFLGATLIGGVAWYSNTAYICPVPLGYRIDTIDSHFNLTHEQAKEHLAAAEAVWEEAVGRDLFYYDEAAALTVDFVFDERQAHADSEQNNRAHLDAMKAEHEAVFDTVAKLQKEYDELSKAYKEKVQQYERRLAEYNQRVTSYNDQGGAPGEIYAELERERAALNTEASSLADASKKLNELVDEVNKLGDSGNQLVDRYNREVARYNKQFGFAQEFTQGDYHDNQINVYKFSSDTELLSVLTHELGHALGIGHVEGASSIMYYLLEDTSVPPELSSEDKEAFQALCGNGDEWQHRLREIIRTLLAKI